MNTYSKPSRIAYLYYDSFCQRYWNRVKQEWVRYPGLDCVYESRTEAEDDYSLYKGEDTAIKEMSYGSLTIALAA